MISSRVIKLNFIFLREPLKGPWDLVNSVCSNKYQLGAIRAKRRVAHLQWQKKWVLKPNLVKQSDWNLIPFFQGCTWASTSSSSCPLFTIVVVMQRGRRWLGRISSSHHSLPSEAVGAATSVRSGGVEDKKKRRPQRKEFSEAWHNFGMYGLLFLCVYTHIIRPDSFAACQRDDQIQQRGGWERRRTFDDE